MKKIPGFVAETLFSGFSEKFSMTAPMETALADRTVTMADAYGCPPGTRCAETKCIQEGCARCEETVPTMCTKSFRRIFDPWYVTCIDFKRYTDGTEQAVSGSYWCGNGGHYVSC